MCTNILSWTPNEADLLLFFSSFSGDKYKTKHEIKMFSIFSTLRVGELEVGKDISTADTRERNSHCASVGLQQKVCRDLSNLPQLLRQKWKFDIPLLYKGYLPPAGFSKGVFSFFFFFERGGKSHYCTPARGYKTWAKGRKGKNLT